MSSFIDFPQSWASEVTFRRFHQQVKLCHIQYHVYWFNHHSHLSLTHSHTNYHPYVSVLMFYRAMKGNIYKTFINTNLFIHIIALGKVITHTHTHGQPRKVSMYKIYVQIQWTHITFTAEHKQKFKLRKCHFQNNISSFWLWWKQQNVGQIDVIAIWKS